MKVVHMCLGCFFPDGFSYQENMLPKFHKQLGYEVEVIASLVTFDKNGKATYIEKGSTYENEYGIPVTRLDNKKPVKIYRILKRFYGVYEALEKANPDILFIHGCQFMDINKVVKYIKSHRNVTVYVDNHADASNSGKNFISRFILHKILWRRGAKKIEPFTKKFYGVLPARVDWLTDMYKLPKNKCELLVMGADDEKIEEAYNNNMREEIRQKYNIGQDDFLIMTGGKIDMAKTQTLLLMEAVHNIKKDNVKLIVFGSVAQELKDKVNELSDGEKVQYIGWVPSDESYGYWSAADLIVFPGRHSVFWEQVAGMGIPMVCKYWEGTTHVDTGGNVKFLEDDSVEEIQSMLIKIMESNIYEDMLIAARGENRKQFLYREIARKSIE